MNQTFQINVNGKTHEITCDPERTLLDVLREDLRLTGTKRGCDIGLCGSCTVLIDGKPKRSCIVKIKDVLRLTSNVPHEKPDFTHDVRRTTYDVLTIEGLSKDGKLHPIQQAFIDCGAVQCGFCTPGMVLTAKALLDKNPNPSREEIRKSLIANLCRCTGYHQIVDAIEQAAKMMKGSI